MKKLSKKERGELVTKGYLEDILEQKLDQKLDEKLDQKFDEKFALWSAEMSRHIASLIEDSNAKFRIMTEGYFDHQVRIQNIEEHVGLK